MRRRRACCGVFPGTGTTAAAHLCGNPAFHRSNDDNAHFTGAAAVPDVMCVTAECDLRPVLQGGGCRQSVNLRHRDECRTRSITRRIDRQVVNSSEGWADPAGSSSKRSPRLHPCSLSDHPLQVARATSTRPSSPSAVPSSASSRSEGCARCST